jgi:HSP20 family protein
MPAWIHVRRCNRKMSMRRRYPFGWMLKDFEDMMNEFEGRFGPCGTRFLPPGGISDRMLPAIRGEFRVDVRDHDDEIIVVADLPGVEKDDVSLNLLNPSTLEIASEKETDREEKEKGYYMRERISGSMSRIVTLPANVREEGAKASFKNGVLEVRFRKSPEERGTRIKID